MSQVMATGRAAMPFSFAAKAKRAETKLAVLSIKTLKQVGRPDNRSDGLLELLANVALFVERERETTANK